MMQLIHIALRKPYTFVVLAILIVLFGVQTTVHMPTDVFPRNILIPVTSVVWAYDGLLPQDVEGRITSLGTARLIEKISHMELPKMGRLRFTSQALQECRELLPKFITYQLGKELKSLKALRTLPIRASFF